MNFGFTEEQQQVRNLARGIAHTGKQVTLTGISILHIESGKIVEECREMDNLGMMQQLGVIPAPGQT
jgi:predicted ester cyclase